MTVKAKYSFTAKISGDDTPWIAFEPISGELRGEGLPSGIFGFDLPKGTTGQRAKEIADYLDKNISHFVFTANDPK